jgi:hypothetical protein
MTHQESWRVSRRLCPVKRRRTSGEQFMMQSTRSEADRDG